MSLLELRQVSKRHTHDVRGRMVLENASLTLEPGELVAVWGMRGSGRTTLLRVAAGVDAPDAGAVYFDGSDLSEHGDEILGREIGYCPKSLPASQNQAALDEILVTLLANGVTASEARSRALSALERVGGQALCVRRASTLDSAERTRLAVAHALSLQPRVLMIDEPVAGVDLLDRDGILLLLRSLADEGIAVLMTVGDSTGLSGADRSLTIGDGELGGNHAPQPARVLPLRRAAGLASGG